MELAPYVADLQRQLANAAETGTDETRAAAERIAAGLDAATRLVLLDALSAAVGEITRDLAPGSVDLRLRGREIEFVVEQPNAEADTHDAPPARRRQGAGGRGGGRRRPLRQRLAGPRDRRGTPTPTASVRAAHAADRRQLRRLGTLARPDHHHLQQPRAPAGPAEHTQKQGVV